jgi:hypothetical protein
MDALKSWGMYYLDLYRPVAKNHAVMFDIDDTLIRASDGMVMFPMVDVLLHAKSIGYKVILITARPRLQDVIEYTKDQMRDLGIPYDELGFCNAEDKGKLKLHLGYHFVLSVGDMWTDLTHTRHGLNTLTLQHF